MSEHCAKINWRRHTESFAYDDYGRSHEWTFDDGTVVAATAAPDFLGAAIGVDPEEAYVASIASCHMLSFLAICARKRIVVDAYHDEAVGVMAKNDQGRLWLSRVELRPRVDFADGPPDRAALEALHHKAHDVCFIANSVATKIVTHID